MHKQTRLKLTAIGLVAATITAISAITLIWHTTKTVHRSEQAHHSTSTPVASPAQLAADEAAYKASAARMTQLCIASDQAKQAEQTALEQYSDTSPQYQTAKTVADKAYDTCQAQVQDTTSKSLQITIDGGSPAN